MKKTLEYYRGLPYHLRVTRFVEDEDQGLYYCASYAQLPEVKGIHQDRLVAVRLAKELFDSYIEAHLDWGEDIPEPASRRSRKPGGLYKIHEVSPSESERASAGPDSADRAFRGDGETADLGRSTTMGVPQLA